MREYTKRFRPSPIRQLPYLWPPKKVYGIQWKAGDGKKFDKEDIRNYLQQKSNEMVAIAPDADLMITLRWWNEEKQREQYRSGEFTKPGEPVHFYNWNPEYDPDPDTFGDILEFQFKFTTI